VTVTAVQGPGVSELLWQLSDASVRGKSHVDAGLPNQDSVFVVTDPSGEVVCAVVSDGAGTASRSGEGSEETASFVARRLCEAGQQLQLGPVRIENIRLELEACIGALRQHIGSGSGDLRDFHCTLVTWLHTRCGSFVAQIGDSVALSTRFAFVGDPGACVLDFFPEGRHRLHEVERGEYSNETHFLTEPDWKEHLRVTELSPDLDAVILMSDGAMDIAMLRGEVFRGFLSNLLAKLIATPKRADRNRIVHEWLDDPKTHRVTGDDKTVFVAIRQKPHALEGASLFIDQRRSNTGAEASGTAPVSSPVRKAAPVARGLAPQTRRPEPVPSTLAAERTAAPARPERARPEASQVLALAPVRSRRSLGAMMALALVATLGVLSVLWWPEPPDRSPGHPGSPVAGSDAMERELWAVQATIAAEAPAKAAALAPAPSPRQDLLLDSEPAFRDGMATAIVALRGGTPLVIRRIAADAELAVDGSRPDACKEKTELLPGRKGCRLIVRIRPGVPPGEYGVDLKFESERDRSGVSRRVVFGSVGDAADYDKRR
jgi:hypothetical protein